MTSFKPGDKIIRYLGGNCFPIKKGEIYTFMCYQDKSGKSNLHLEETGMEHWFNTCNFKLYTPKEQTYDIF